MKKLRASQSLSGPRMGEGTAESASDGSPWSLSVGRRGWWEADSWSRSRETMRQAISIQHEHFKEGM